MSSDSRKARTPLKRSRLRYHSLLHARDISYSKPIHGSLGYLNSRQVDRLWGYRNLVDQEFFGRQNFFLVFESILLAIAGQLATRPEVPELALRSSIVLGLLIMLIWMYSQARIKSLLEHLRKLCRDYVPEYGHSRMMLLRPCRRKTR
jgi:hypothetical protein